MPSAACEFVFPCPGSWLSSGVCLKDFDLELYGRTHWETLRQHPQLLVDNDGRLPEETLEDLAKWVEWKHADPETLLLAIESTKDGKDGLAGFFMFTHVSARQLTAAVDLLVYPRFQPTHVTTQTCFLMLEWAFREPEKGGLGLRRVEWLAYTFNTASQNAAERLGFQLEGIRRNDRPIDPRVTHLGREVLSQIGQPARGRALDCCVYSLCWEDWDEGGVRDKLALLAQRPP